MNSPDSASFVLAPEENAHTSYLSHYDHLKRSEAEAKAQYLSLVNPNDDSVITRLCRFLVRHHNKSIHFFVDTEHINSFDTFKASSNLLKCLTAYHAYDPRYITYVQTETGQPKILLGYYDEQGQQRYNSLLQAHKINGIVPQQYRPVSTIAGVKEFLSIYEAIIDSLPTNQELETKWLFDDFFFQLESDHQPGSGDEQ